MVKSRKTEPGALGSISRRTISLLAACVLGGVLAGPAAGRDNIPELVVQAARPELMFGRPAEFDSLLTQISAGGESAAQELLDLAGTHWAWQFEVIRRALERLGDTARQVVLARLAGGKLPDNETYRLLVLFEKLGREGDESALGGYLRAESRSLVVPALRCLAAFGAPEKSLQKITSLLGSEDSHIRLAAVWTGGELLRRGDKSKLPSETARNLRRLTADPSLQIRLTAGEVLALADAGQSPGLIVGEEK